MATRVRDADRSPFNAIGVLQLNFDNGNTYHGTGALINSTTILTCAHNLTDRGQGVVPRVSSINFFPAYNQQPFPVTNNCQVNQGCYRASCAFAALRYKGGEQDWDIGLIKLAQPIQRDFYFVPVITRDQSLVDQDLDITGYPGDKNGEMWTDSDEVANIDIALNTLLFVVDTEAGSSGSPVYKYNALDDKVYQFAVHVARTDAHGLKRAILITPAIGGWINNAIQTACNATFLRYL